MLFTFDIDRNLTAGRRKAINKEIEAYALASEKKISYGWDDADPDKLLIKVEPATLEIRFEDKKVTLSVSLPLWAKMAVTKKNKQDLQDIVGHILEQAKFFRP